MTCILYKSTSNATPLRFFIDIDEISLTVNSYADFSHTRAHPLIKLRSSLHFTETIIGAPLRLYIDAYHNRGVRTLSNHLAFAHVQVFAHHYNLLSHRYPPLKLSRLAHP